MIESSRPRNCRTFVDGQIRRASKQLRKALRDLQPYPGGNGEYVWLINQLDVIDKHRLLVTTNRAFQEWGDLFPNATCVVPLVDRLVHKADIFEIDGDSYRLKEAQERAQRRKV